MNRAQHRAILESMIAWDQEPTLSEQEVETLLDLNRRPDLYGLWPSATGWTPTYDLYRAAAEGWRWKAGKCAERFDFSSDVHSFSRDQLQKHCLAMVEQYAMGEVGSVAIVLGCIYDPVIGNLNGGN